MPAPMPSALTVAAYYGSKSIEAGSKGSRIPNNACVIAENVIKNSGNKINHCF